MSMWTCSSLVETGRKVPGGEMVWRVTLESWHLTQLDRYSKRSVNVCPAEQSLTQVNHFAPLGDEVAEHQEFLVVKNSMMQGYDDILQRKTKRRCKLACQQSRGIANCIQTIRDRNHKKGGCVLLYVKSNIHGCVLEKVKLDAYDCLWVELTQANREKMNHHVHSPITFQCLLYPSSHISSPTPTWPASSHPPSPSPSREYKQVPVWNLRRLNLASRLWTFTKLSTPFILRGTSSLKDQNANYESEDRFGHGYRRHVHDLLARTCLNFDHRLNQEKHADPSGNATMQTPPADILRIETVDLLAQENGKDHKTIMYEVVQEDNPSPIFRRGQTFYMTLTTKEREFDTSRDLLYVNFYFGPNPSVPKRTRIVLPVTTQKEFSRAPQRWDVRIHNQDAKTLTLQVNIPTTSVVGIMRCVVETATRSFPRARLQYRMREECYVIFNPFNKEDPVYVENEAQRNEYIINDSGKIFTGTQRNPKGRPFIFGQFNDVTLPAAMVLLEMSRLPHTERGNPVKVVRAITRMMKTRSYLDDASLDASMEGLMQLRYEGDLRGGETPHQMTGAMGILSEFFRGCGRPVRFAHCWLLAGVMTALCRSLGLAARPVTSYMSAEETLDTLTVDRYVDRFGDVLERGPFRDQSDNVRSFFVFCDVMMMRPDLPNGYSGFQAADPARCDRYNALSNSCGPSSAEAIRKGDIGFNYESDAMFSAFNAYVRYFYEDEESDHGFTMFKQFRKRMNQTLLTKACGLDDEESDGDMEDVTALYCDPERSDPERFAVMNACRGIPKDVQYHVVPDAGANDVDFELVEPQRTMAGQPLTVSLTVSNTSAEARTVQAIISTRAVYYHGVHGPPLKRATGQFTLAAGQKDTLHLVIEADEYVSRLVDMGIVKVTASGLVQETKQSFIDEYDFRFDKPKLRVEVGECQANQDCQVIFSFTNPLDTLLTDCSLSFEIAGSHRPRTIYINRDVRPQETFNFTQQFRPREVGENKLVAAFTSRQLQDIVGARRVIVRE
ncbi:hemocyte protein-glutamine gamma-glutamyltransferase-like [Oratosquilla oratoria]|uniref:hemocyte protein-glutamine gamma-glutamyltransferase-like n=1 Tax=Oratosquilla oratoria TaxID=337810 RepID=UPI003F76D1CF